MNLILLFPEDFVDDCQVRLTGRRLEHVRAVHRAGVGDELRVGLLNDRIGSGRVTELTADRLEMSVELLEPPPPVLPLTLLLALPRPKSLKRVIQAVTTMGVKRMVLMHTWRVEKSYWSSPALAQESLRQEMILGLEQARDCVLPSIAVRRRFKPFVEDEVAQIAAGSVGFVAHPGVGEPCPRAVGGPVTLAVGPEGGFIDYEVALFRRQGFETISLGPRRLRAEQAIAVLLGRLF